MRKQDRCLTLRNNRYKELTLLNRERYIWLLVICWLLSGSFVTLWTAGHQAPLSMEFSEQEYWSGLPFPSLVVQTVESACNAGELGSIPGSGRSPVERNGYPLQYSCLESPMNRGAWQAIVHWVTKRWIHCIMGIFCCGAWPLSSCGKQSLECGLQQFQCVNLGASRHVGY